MNKKKELGSEFWNMPSGKRDIKKPFENLQYTLSGRTALELVLRDLIAEREIQSICLPAYCCESMIQPFSKAGLKIRFYDVCPSTEGVHRNLPKNHGCDVVLLLDYFGFLQDETRVIAEREHLNGKVVILDCVQSLFSEPALSVFSDYVVTSWRKWFFSCAGAAAKRSGDWMVKLGEHTNARYVSLRREAAKKKTDYVENGVGDKKVFLDDFKEAEEILDADFSDYAADSESVDALGYLDIALLRRQRRENANVIYKTLHAIDDKRVQPLFPTLGADDTPLFVPVLVEPSIRTALRQYLIHNQVYCPIHWPDARTGGGQILYAQELSLLCDQRYTVADVEWEMNLIQEFLLNRVLHLFSPSLREIK